MASSRKRVAGIEYVFVVVVDDGADVFECPAGCHFRVGVGSGRAADVDEVGVVCVPAAFVVESSGWVYFAVFKEGVDGGGEFGGVYEVGF